LSRSIISSLRKNSFCVNLSKEWSVVVGNGLRKPCWRLQKISCLKFYPERPDSFFKASLRLITRKNSLS